MREGSTTVVSTDQYGPDVFDPLDVEEVLHAWSADAFVLARYGRDREAGIIGALVTDIEIATCLWLEWLSEEKAIADGGVTRARLDAIFIALKGTTLVRQVKGQREYRACIFPKIAKTIETRLPRPKIPELPAGAKA